MANNVFNHYRELNEIVMGGELDDLDASVKVLINGVEYVVQSTELETADDGSQTLWLNAVEDE